MPLAGLAGFALGAATVLLMVWLFRREGAPRFAPVSAPVSATSNVAPAAPLPSPAPVLAPPTDLEQRDLLLPVQGVRRDELRDTFADARGAGRVHDAIDIMAPRDTPVLAVDAGRIVKVFASARGGLTIYHFDPTETYGYYYAHLDHYAPGIHEGMPVARGQVIGSVGSTGNASPEGPHLHFAIFRLNAQKNWWQGEAINPYPLLR